MSKTLKKFTILLVVSLAVIGGIWGGLSATATAQSSDEDALIAEVEAVSANIELAFNTGDADLFYGLWLQSEKASYISLFQPFVIDGWTNIQPAFAGLLGLPAGSIDVSIRQPRIEIYGDDSAIQTYHFLIRVQPPGAPPTTFSGRGVWIYQKIDGEWLIVHGHLSDLPD